jgi:hypothetical protein
MMAGVRPTSLGSRPTTSLKESRCVTIVSQISASDRSSKRPAFIELEIVETDAAVASLRLLLLPAEDLEERLRVGLVADLARKVLDGLLVAGLHQAEEHLRVRLAQAQPLGRRLRPAAERRALRGRIAEAGRAVELGDRRRLEQLGDAQHALGRHHARRLAIVEQQHRLADRSQVVLVEGHRAAFVLDRLAGAGLTEQQRRASDLEITPLGLLQRVAREVREQRGVQEVDVEQLAVEDGGRRHEQARLDGGAAELLLRALARVPHAADVEAGPVVPQVRGRVEDEIEQALGGPELRLGEGRGLGHVGAHLRRGARASCARRC